MSQAHWDSVYTANDLDELGWYEPRASTLELVTAYSTPADSLIDVGGGASPLAVELAELGYRDLTVLDISERALEASRTALREHAEVVTWIRADVTRFGPDRRWQLWHDRAVFHFLVEQDDREAYRAVAASAVEPGGVLMSRDVRPRGARQVRRAFSAPLRRRHARRRVRAGLRPDRGSQAHPDRSGRRPAPVRRCRTPPRRIARIEYRHVSRLVAHLCCWRTSRRRVGSAREASGRAPGVTRGQGRSGAVGARAAWCAIDGGGRSPRRFAEGASGCTCDRRAGQRGGPRCGSRGVRAGAAGRGAGVGTVESPQADPSRRSDDGRGGPRSGSAARRTGWLTPTLPIPRIVAPSGQALPETSTSSLPR